MSTAQTTSLPQRRNELSRRVILDAAVDLLETAGAGELTIRAVARHANISERTLFRHFPTRDDFLDAIADEVRTRLPLPPAPQTIAELRALPRLLYEGFEAKRQLVIANLHSAISARLREGAAPRWASVAKLIDHAAPKLAARDRKIAAMNISFYLNATSWRYHRFFFKLSLDDTIACAERAIALVLDSLGA